MTAVEKIVLSASRRTDIPAFYMPWFMEQIAAGILPAVNPYNGHTRWIEAAPDKIHTIVFWSKNFAPMLSRDWDLQLRDMGFGLFFHFTINSENRILEPKVPSLEKRLEQLELLCRRHGPQAVQWRFDPICHWYDTAGKAQNNVQDLELIAAAAGKAGITSCVTSFADLYRKVIRRAEASPITFFDPDVSARTKLILEMEKTLAGLGISLQTCCEKNVLANLPPGSRITAGSCIDGRRLTKLNGPGISLRRDPGQRSKSGCRCTVSVDIGNYRLHPCRHGCLFCYANPAGSTGGKVP